MSEATKDAFNVESFTEFESGVEVFINAATEHGLSSEPDHEVGDLQDMLRAAWSIMTIDQRLLFVTSPACKSTIESALGIDYDAEPQEP